jgi:integrase
MALGVDNGSRRHRSAGHEGSTSTSVVRYSLQLVGNCFHFSSRFKTAAGIRRVWLTDHCRDVLLAWQKILGQSFSPFVFPSPRDPISHIADYKKAWRDAAKKAGFADKFFRIYDLRATFGSRANMAQATSMTLAHLLGHSSITILPVYTKPIDENTKMVIEKLDEARRQIRNLKQVVQ